MRKTIIVTIIVLSCCRINAQTFTGTVYDKATNQPISGVYVSFNGTVAYTITDNLGKFELTVAQRLNTQLVFSHIAYNMVIIENPFDKLPEEIYMEERVNMLDDVVVSARQLAEYADPFTRAQKLKTFREQFLGTTRAGKSCFIMNEADLELRYSVQTNTLYASSDNPIVVVNEYLGYMVSFTLLDFRIEYAVQLEISGTGKSPSLSGGRLTSGELQELRAQGRELTNTELQELRAQREGMSALQLHSTSRSYNIQRSYFTVISLFTDLSPDDRKIKSRRDDVYEQSSTNFFKNIANNTLGKSNFRIHKDRRNVVDQSLYFAIEDDDTFSLKTIRFIPESGSIINVRYRNKPSNIQFLTDTLLVDRYGNIDKFDKVLFTGVMGESRAGDMLPVDYEP